MIEPQGPLPPEIYWRRRIVAGLGVLAFVGLVVVLIFSALPKKDDGKQVAATSLTPAQIPSHDDKPSVPANPDGEESGSKISGSTGNPGNGYGSTENLSSQSGNSASSSKSGNSAYKENQASTQAAGVTANTAAPDPAKNFCTDQSLSVVLYTDKPTYKVGDQPIFTIAVTNGGLVDCTRDIGKSAQNVIVRSLDGTRTLWSARDCSPLRSVNNVVFRPGQQERDTVNWSGTTSTPGCHTPRQPIPPGAYRAIAKIGERESAPITFNVVSPAQQP